MKLFYVAALTGRSGTGKSLASEYLAKKGVPVIDGDVVAREVVTFGSKCLKELTEEFSSDILNADGTLNRKALADIAFSDLAKKTKLDSIIHPYIIDDILNRFDALHKQGYKYCVVEAAALIESGLYANCDKIIMVKSSREKQIERIIQRDGLTKEQAVRRLDAQLSDELVKQLADWTIVNDGTEQEFYKKLDELIEMFKKWFEKE